jgi:hypothetical protein
MCDTASHNASTHSQRLRSASQPLQSREHHRSTFETKTSFELIKAHLTTMSFPLQHAKSDEAAGHVMPLGALGSCLTAAQPELVLACTDYFLNVGAKGVQAAYFSGRQRQAIRGIVLGAVSDDQDLQPTGQQASRCPIGMPPIRPERLAIEPAVLL